MSYEPPHLSVQQEFEALPPDVRSDQIVCLVGPRRKVSKPGVAPEAEIMYGSFTPGAEMNIEFDGLPSGETVDPGGVKLFLNELLAEYAEVDGVDDLQVGSSPSLIVVGTGSPSDEAFAEGNGAERLTPLGERDVKVGDRLIITHESGTLSSRVVALIDEMSDPVVSDVSDAAVFNSSSNPNTASASFTPAIVTSAVSGRVTGDLVDGGGYTGDLSKGIVFETYTLTVTTGGGYSTAVVAWESSNGDNTGSGTVGANATAPMTIGTRGASVEFPQLVARPLAVGEVFTIAVVADYDRATATVSGTYEGTVDTSYVITVIKGGLWASSPKVSVVSNNGADASSIQTITAITDPILLGNKGLSIELDGVPGLRLGDVYVVSVTTSESIGKRIMKIANPLPTDNGGTPVNTEGTSVAVRFLSRQARLEIPAISYPEFGDENWTNNGTSLTLSNSLNVYDPTVLDADGDPVAIPVVSGNIEIHYTATLETGAGISRTISSTSTIEGLLGPVAPDNELAFATNFALLNSGGVHVVTIQTAGHTAADYREALRIAERLTDVYFIIPTSNNQEVIDAVIGHIGSMNGSRKGKERVAIVNVSVPTTTDLFVDVDEDTKWSGYIAADGLGGYTALTMPGAAFVAAGVRNGDFVRANFRVAPDGSDVFNTYKVFEVVDEENITLLTGPSASVGTPEIPARMEVYRVNSPLEVAEAARNSAEGIGNRKIFNVFPDTAETSAGETVSGFNLAAAVGGLASSVVAHQPITEFEITGFSEIPFLTKFTPDELDIAAGGGNLIVMQDVPGGRIYIRHQISTDNSNTLKSEMSITRGTDMVTRYLRTAVRPLVGPYNITPEYLQMIETLGQQRLDAMVLALSTTQAGPPILSNDRIRATQDPSVATGFIMDVPVVMPKPANKGTIRIYVS